MTIFIFTSRSFLLYLWICKSCRRATLRQLSHSYTGSEYVIHRQNVVNGYRWRKNGLARPWSLLKDCARLSLQWSMLRDTQPGQADDLRSGVLPLIVYRYHPRSLDIRRSGKVFHYQKKCGRRNWQRSSQSCIAPAHRQDDVLENLRIHVDGNIEDWRWRSRLILLGYPYPELGEWPRPIFCYCLQEMIFRIGMVWIVRSY